MENDIFTPEELAILGEEFGGEASTPTETTAEQVQTDEEIPSPTPELITDTVPSAEAQALPTDTASIAELIAQQREQEAARASREDKIYELLNRYTTPQAEAPQVSEEEAQVQSLLSPYLTPLQERINQLEQTNQQLTQEREAARQRDFDNSINTAIETVKATYPDFDPTIAGQYLAEEIQKIVALGAPEEVARNIVLKTQGADPKAMARIWAAHKAATTPPAPATPKRKPDEHIPQPGNAAATKNYKDMLMGDRDAQVDAIGELFR